VGPLNSSHSVLRRWGKYGTTGDWSVIMYLLKTKVFRFTICGNHADNNCNEDKLRLLAKIITNRYKTRFYDFYHPAQKMLSPLTEKG
jgi:hypothetical protein